MIRKEEGAITPWNFESKVDVDKSAVEFIRKMTNKCTYLIGKDVIPRNSLLYREYMVLNELNNVKIKGEKISLSLKQSCIKDVFKNKDNKRVTITKFLKFLKAEGINVSKEDISGIDGDFKAALTTYIDFKKVFKSKIEEYPIQQMIEQIILWITLYGQEKSMLKRVIRNAYTEEQLSNGDLKAILKFKYEGWGNFSSEFLTEVRGVNKENGEVYSIIEALRHTNDNLMQLLSQNYTFTEEVEKYNQGEWKELTEITYDTVVQDMMVSPSVKRAIWQVVRTAEEIKRIQKQVPCKIFIEVAREHQDSKRTKSRKDQLLALYAQCKEEERDWKAELESRAEADFRSIKLYLYYTQMGRCMYSGDRIELSELANTQVYDKDHIYPQSQTKDDSLDNLVLVKKKINADKNNGVISSSIQQERSAWWKELRKKGFISEEKYNRLTRKTPLTDIELAGFINRQLVETRQSTKAIAELFKQLYPESEVVYVKAKAVADFRHEVLDMVKVRMLNDLHHAKDAYLNIVVGNVYHEKFTNAPLQWLGTTKNRQYNLSKMFEKDLVKGDKVIGKVKETLQQVRKQYLKDDICYTRYALCNKSGNKCGLFNQQAVKAKASLKVGLKKGLDPAKYGGYDGITPAYFALIEGEVKGKVVRRIEAVHLYLIEQFEKNEEEFVKYCKMNFKLNNPRIVIPKIKKDSLIVIEGFPMSLRGTTGTDQLDLQCGVQLKLDLESVTYLKKIEKYLQRNAERGDKNDILPIREWDGITTELNQRIYDVLISKLQNSIYCLRRNNPIEELLKRKDAFIQLSIENQSVILGEIIKITQCKPVTADLSLIGGKKNAGKITVNRNISIYKSVYLVNTSVTGLFEEKVDLLTL